MQLLDVPAPRGTTGVTNSPSTATTIAGLDPKIRLIDLRVLLLREIHNGGTTDPKKPSAMALLKREFQIYGTRQEQIAAVNTKLKTMKFAR